MERCFFIRKKGAAPTAIFRQCGGSLNDIRRLYLRRYIEMKKNKNENSGTVISDLCVSGTGRYISGHNKFSCAQGAAGARFWPGCGIEYLDGKLYFIDNKIFSNLRSASLDGLSMSESLGINGVREIAKSGQFILRYARKNEAIIRTLSIYMIQKKKTRKLKKINLKRNPDRCEILLWLFSRVQMMREFGWRVLETPLCFFKLQLRGISKWWM